MVTVTCIFSLSRQAYEDRKAPEKITYTQFDYIRKSYRKKTTNNMDS